MRKSAVLLVAVLGAFIVLGVMLVVLTIKYLGIIPGF